MLKKILKRTLKRTPLLIVIAIVIVAVFGCHSAPVALSSHQSAHGFKLYGNFTKSQQETLDELVSILPTTMINAITFIAKVDFDEHFDAGEGGHCWPIGRICIRGYFITYH